MRAPRVSYSAAELQWLEVNQAMVISDYTAAFNAEFGRDVTAGQLSGLRKRKRWLIGRDAAAEKARGRSTAYTVAEIAWLESHAQLRIRDYARQFKAAFGRSVSPDKLHQLRKRRRWRTGRDGQFVKGQTPHNAGKKCRPGVGGNHPNAKRTQFKKGTLSGRAAENIKPIGFERVSREGYIERKTNNDLPFNRRWRGVHIIRWEALHGPVPGGHCLKCRDGDKANTDPENWELISRATLPLLNGRHGIAYDDVPDKLKPTALAIARVKAARNAKRKQQGKAKA